MMVVDSYGNLDRFKPVGGDLKLPHCYFTEKNHPSCVDVDYMVSIQLSIFRLRSDIRTLTLPQWPIGTGTAEPIIADLNLSSWISCA